MRYTLGTLVTCLGLTVGGAALGAPGDRTTHLASPGTSQGVSLHAVDADGSRLVFSSDENLTADDTDQGALDIYERNTATGQVRLISGGSGNVHAFFAGATPNGSHIWFSSSERYESGGGPPNIQYVYQRTVDGQLTRVSPSFFGSPVSATFRGATHDGSRVWFETAAPVAAGDTDLSIDVYERSAAGVRRISDGNGAVDASFAGATPTGSHVWWRTHEPRPLFGDSDTSQDVFETRSGGATRLVSSQGNADYQWRGGSPDGSQVWFQAFTATTCDEFSPPGCFPQTFFGAVWVSSHGGGVETLRSFSDPHDEPGISAEVVVADDSSRSFFTTPDALTADDLDTALDVFELTAAGALRLRSAGTLNRDAFLEGVSANGEVVWFSTAEMIAGTGDIDTNVDIYEARSGSPARLVSSGSDTADSLFGGAAPDGSSVSFLTTSTLVPDDAGGSDSDGYIRHSDGSLALITRTTSGVSIFSLRGSRDGSQIFYVTQEALDPGDTDARGDIYESRLAVPQATSQPVTSGGVTVGQARSCSGGTFAGQGLGAPSIDWLRGGVTIGGATGGTYVLTPADAGLPIACRVSVSNIMGAGTSESAAAVVAPFAARRAAVRGFPILKTNFTCSAGILGSTSRTTTWRRGARIVSTAPTYRIGAADLRARITCTVTAKGPGGVATTVSTPRSVPAVCRVTRLRGGTLAVARVRLGDRGCRTRTLREAGAGVARGRVLGTIPAAGSRVPNGTTVTIRVRR